MPTEYSVDKEDLDLTPDQGHPFQDPEKDIIDGNIIEECRGYDNCKDVYRVFASLTDDARRQNDVNSAWRTGDVVSFTFFKEVDGVFVTANYSPVTVAFDNEPNAFYTTIEWRDVADQDGYGCFKLVTNSQIAGLPQPFLNWQTYTLEPYLIDGCLNPNVVGTARILSEFNDMNDFLGLDFTGSRILDSVRLNAKVGYFNDNTEIDMVEYIDGTNEKVSIEDFVSYELRLNLSGFCVVEFLRMHLLQANRQWISDYNFDSYSYLTDDVPVVLKEGLEPEFFDGSRNIKGVVKFRDKISKRRTHFQNNRITAEDEAPPHVCPLIPTPTPSATSTMPLRTGQTTSYRTGDDGDLENGRGAAIQTLSSNNPYGNLNRQTDILGTQSYADDIVIDWGCRDYTAGTVLGYYRISRLASSWNDADDTALGFSVGIFTTGWFLPNANEMWNVSSKFEGNTSNLPMNYAPYNISFTGNFWTSTSRAIASSQAHALINNSGYGWNTISKTTTTAHHIYARIFTLTELGL